MAVMGQIRGGAGGGVEPTTSSVRSMGLNGTYQTISGVTPTDGMIVTVCYHGGATHYPYGGVFYVKNGSIVDITGSSFTEKASAQISSGSIQLKINWTSSTQNCDVIVATP